MTSRIDRPYWKKDLFFSYPIISLPPTHAYVDAPAPPYAWLPPLLFVLDLFNLRGYVGYSKLFREKKKAVRGCVVGAGLDQYQIVSFNPLCSSNSLRIFLLLQRTTHHLSYPLSGSASQQKERRERERNAWIQRVRSIFFSPLFLVITRAERHLHYSTTLGFCL